MREQAIRFSDDSPFMLFTKSMKTNNKITNAAHIHAPKTRVIGEPPQMTDTVCNVNNGILDKSLRQMYCNQW